MLPSAKVTAVSLSRWYHDHRGGVDIPGLVEKTVEAVEGGVSPEALMVALELEDGHRKLESEKPL